MNTLQQLKTPVYICDTKRFKENISEFRDSVKQHYTNYRLGYSFKTNYYIGFCKAVKELGEYAEVVSQKEYTYARQIGFADDEIIYNGVIEDFENKLNVALNGGIVNIDNVCEFMKFVEWSNKNKKKIELGLRFNIDVGNGILSRFGIDPLSKDFELIKDNKNRKYVSIKSVHCHVSQARSLEFFKRRVDMMADIAKTLGARIVDIGGNMFGRMDERFASQFNEHVPTFEEYAETIGESMKRHFHNEDVTLITEDGTPVCSNAMHLLSKVICIKEMKDKQFIVLDTKREDVGASCITKIPSTINIGGCEPCNRIEAVDATAFGCTCVEIDYLLRKYDGMIGVGDKLLFLNIGAYSLNNDCDFITNKPRCIRSEDIPDFEKMYENKCSKTCKSAI